MCPARRLVPKKTVYGWCRQIIGVRLGEGKAGYRIPRSGLIIFLADLDEAPPDVTPEELEEQRAANRAEDESNEPPEREYIASSEDYADSADEADDVGEE